MSYLPENDGKFNLGKRIRLAASDASDVVDGEIVVERKGSDGRNNSRIFADTA